MTINSLLTATHLATVDRLKVADLMDARGYEYNEDRSSADMAHAIINGTDADLDMDWLVSTISDIRTELIRRLIATTATLDDLHRGMVAASIIVDRDGATLAEICNPEDLPIFGDWAPESTQDIYSWDDRRILTIDINGAWILVDRKDADAAA